jgi:hypothetical protein
MMSAGLSCASNSPAAPPAKLGEAHALKSLHVRLEVNPQDGAVTYLGWYDGKRNLLGPGGIVCALVGMEPPEMQGELKRISAQELRFDAIDQNRMAWQKRFTISENSVEVLYRITNRRDQAFDAIIYSLADLPDATISGDNRDQYIHTPLAEAHFHAFIDNPNFPGEQMSPYAMRSDSRRLESGESMELQMNWELAPPK